MGNNHIPFCFDVAQVEAEKKAVIELFHKIFDDLKNFKP